MMRQVSKGLLTVAAAGGMLAVTGGFAYADAGAQGGAVDSRGIVSGDTVQAPVHVPVGVCGNTVNVLGALNPVTGTQCGHASGGAGGASARGVSRGSSGVVSGDVVQVPVDVPVGVCGNSVNVLGARNPVTGAGCGASGGGGGASAGGVSRGSSGVVSGDVVQVPVDVPVGVCGNSVNVLGAGNAVTGGGCGHPSGGGQGGSSAGGSTGIGSGGTVRVPIDVSVTVCGNSVNIAGIGTPVSGAACEANPGQPAQPGHPAKPQGPKPSHHTGGKHTTGNLRTETGAPAELAHTGAGGVGMAAAVSAGLLVGGTVLYRRSRAGALT